MSTDPTNPINPTTANTYIPQRIDEYLKKILNRNNSDLHFIANDPPRIHLYNKLQPLRPKILSPQFVEETLREIMPRTTQQQLEEKHNTDFTYIIPDISHFRINIMRHLYNLKYICHTIPSKTLTLDELNIPNAVRNLYKINNNLILVTNKTNSNKSTTLTTMIDNMNSHLKNHILTIEDPIEFVHPHKNYLINQREISTHNPSFSETLLSTLREDPDIILIDELHDYETMSIAITTTEISILMMGTLHTNSTAPTVDRIINAFPTNKQQHMRTMLSTSLHGMISQQLIPHTNKSEHVTALEIIMNTPTIANLIQQNKLDQLENTMQSGTAHNMRTMDSTIQELLDKNTINNKNTYKKSINKTKFEPIKDMD